MVVVSGVRVVGWRCGGGWAFLCCLCLFCFGFVIRFISTLFGLTGSLLAWVAIPDASAWFEQLKVRFRALDTAAGGVEDAVHCLVLVLSPAELRLIATPSTSRSSPQVSYPSALLKVAEVLGA